MIKKSIRLFTAISAAALAGQATAGDKPLKVYIMAGQSNMQGQAQVRTIERLPLAGGNKEMYQDMTGGDGQPDAPKGVYGVYFTGGDMKKGEARPLEESKGPGGPGFTENPDPSQKFGPEYTFGIYMQKHLGEPIMIIKTAWGGRNLLQQFRPPSAGPYENEKDNHGNPTGAYYQIMMNQVKSTLANLGDYHPDYDPAKGYEIAGFVWFQGFNDLIGPYDGDYSEYSRLMACFIRDVRKDLEAPKAPFVIGVMGIGGVVDESDGKQFKFRQAQAAPAAMPEFQGNVAAVLTGQYWDAELKKIDTKLKGAVREKLTAEDPELKGRKLDKTVQKQAKKYASEFLEPEEIKIMETGVSNQAYHYMGSALIYGNIGKAFADAMHELSSK